MPRFGKPSDAGVALMIGIGVLAGGCSSSPDRTERRGNFEIEYRRREAIGHAATQQTVYYVKDQHRTLVAEYGGELVIPPGDPDRMVYRTCDSSAPAGGDDVDACAHMYFDGHSGRNHLIGRGLAVAASQLDDSDTKSNGTASRWAKDFVVLGDQYEFVLLDLTTGTATRLAERLDLQSPRYPENWQHRQGRWAGWSPDGTHAAIVVMSPLGPDLPVIDWQEHLYSLEGSTGTVTHVATHTGRLGGRSGNGLWQSRDIAWHDGVPRPPP